MRGRKPKPTALRVIQGNPGKRTINTEEPQPDAIAPTCPPELTDPVAIAQWQDVIVPAIARGQITVDDRANAIGLCELWAKYRMLRAEEAKHPPVVAVGKNKYPMLNPAGLGADKVLERFVKLSAELGLTVTSRTRVKANQKPAVDEMKVKYFGASRRRA
jgi:phage terminase small subunit